ncbi:MAG: amidohydrolase family protein [Gemmatimonadetes bacterium]|nr:amidohydrolase family protein [Gemmatimonadota bacterium]
MQPSSSALVGWALRRRPAAAPRFVTVPCVLVALALLTGDGRAQEPAPADSTKADSAYAAWKKERKVTLPLEPADTLRFSLDEASWISLDVTPDGRQVVFEVLGDLYRMPIEGGEARPITRGLPFDAQPSVSPDGEWVAFISDRDGNDNLWIGRLGDGLLTDLKKLSSERRNRLLSPTWTPDSRYVIATRAARGMGLRMYHVAGGSGVDLAEPGEGGGDEESPGGGGGGRSELGASMAPDGRHLYFARSGGGGPGGTFPSWQVARRDMVTGEIDPVTQAEWSAVRPVVSPDGRHVVYATRHETRTGLRIRDLETGGDRWLLWPVQRDAMEGGSQSRDLLPAYAFTPDGAEILTTRDGKIVAVGVGTGDVRTIPFRVEVEQPIGPDITAPYRVEQGPVRARLVQSPALSPDGRRATFSVLTHVYVLDLPDGEPRRLTADTVRAFQPAWSPDGRWIAYVTWTVDGGHIWKTRADGSGQPERLTVHPAFYTDLAWAPDGERIVALRGNAWQRTQTFSEFGGLRIPLDVVWMPAEGGEARLVVPARGVGAPHFADDPERIYVYSNDGLMSLRFDGTDRRVHLKVTGRPNPRAPRPPPAQTVLMRPDGQWALASSANQLYVVAVPRVGGPGPTVSLTGGGVPVKKITDIGADYFGWADGGETIYWAVGSTLYRRPFDTVDFEEEDRPSGATDTASAAEAEAEAEEEDPDEELADRAEGVVRTDIVLTFPRDVPRGTVALRGARVVTMDPRRRVIENADLVVRDDRIVAVGPRGSVDIPEGAREMDVAGRTIVPGFIDTHAHWEFRTHDVLEPHNWTLLANLAYGVTAGLDVQTSTNDYFAYQDLVDIGRSIGQRAFMTGPGVFSTNDFQSYEETEAYLRRYQEHYRTPNIKSYMVGTRQQRQWVVRAAKELGLMPTTEGGSDLTLDLTHAIDGFHGNEHNIPIVPLFEDVVQLYARTRTAYTPTLVVNYGGPNAREYFFQSEDVHGDPKLGRFTPHNRLDEMVRRRRLWVMEDEHTFDEVAAAAAAMQRAGGLVGVGGHGELQGLGYHWEMWALSMGGMEPAEVLQAATIDGARIIGVDADLGSLEAGKLADLVVLDASPLDDIRNTNTVRWVMKGGRLYEGDTLRQVWPEERDLPALWWWDAGPREVTPTGER